MSHLQNLYDNFELIDVDAQGGFARVAKIDVLKPKNGQPKQCAFKVMRPVSTRQDWLGRFQRFIDEITIIQNIFEDKTNNSKIIEMLTPIYDFGFVSAQLPQALTLHDKLPSKIEIMQSQNLNSFIESGKKISDSDSENWCPFIVEELVDSEDSLFRQIDRRPKSDPSGSYRLPTGEVIYIAVCLLDLIEYLYCKQNRAYFDWKPEHIYWNPLKKMIKLIDWNVTIPLDESSNRSQNIQDDLRNFCGSVIYTSLTMVEITNGKPIGPKPTSSYNNPISEIRNRWTTDDPVFYQANRTLDDKIKLIIRNGLNPNIGYKSPDEFKMALIEYSKSVSIEINPAAGTASNFYWLALKEIRESQQSLNKLSITHKLGFPVNDDVPSVSQILKSLPAAPDRGNTGFAI